MNKADHLSEDTIQPLCLSW